MAKSYTTSPPKPSERTAVHKRALDLFDQAARLCRADATMMAVEVLAAAAEALREAQNVFHGPTYRADSDRATSMLDPVHDSVLKLRALRGELGGR